MIIERKELNNDVIGNGLDVPGSEFDISQECAGS